MFIDVVSLYLNWKIQQDIQETMKKIQMSPPAQGDENLLSQVQILNSNLTQYPSEVGHVVNQVVTNI